MERTHHRAERCVSAVAAEHPGMEIPRGTEELGSFIGQRGLFNVHQNQLKTSL